MVEEQDQDTVNRASSVGLPTQIEHVVYVMFENRSLDNVLGWLYEAGPPKNMVPPLPGGPSYDGLPLLPPHSLPFKDQRYPIQRGVGEHGTTVPNLDPYEDFPHVMNQLFGAGDPDRPVHNPPPDGTVPGMEGFLQDFSVWWESWDRFLQMTNTYTEHELPVLYGLARQFAVSDRWYSSMPTQTNPNRAFSLCGTSLGRLSNDNEWATEQFETRTIWNALYTNGVSMAIFYHDVWENGQCYTEYTFPHIRKVDPALRPITQINDPSRGFWNLAKQGNLPAFSYIEPKWGYGVTPDLSVQGNDYHPPTDVKCGEKLLYDIYSALRANKDKWPKTLLIVTFDEHGGTYDHRSPPWGATNPGDKASKENPNFDFHLFGVRVPTLLISPYVEQSTVFRSTTDVPYDHTSILATLLRWKRIDPKTAGLFDRVAVAPTFEGVFANSIVNQGIDLKDPGECTSTEVDRILGDIPAAARRHIVLTARNLDDVTRMAEQWRATEGGSA